MPKTIYIDPGTIRPLPKAMQGIGCAVCNRVQSVWERTHVRTQQSGDPVCSLCWMYETGWGKDNKEALSEFVSEVEDSLSALFKKTEDAKLERCEDADRIMSALVLTTRMFKLKGVR